MGRIVAPWSFCSGRSQSGSSRCVSPATGVVTSSTWPLPYTLCSSHVAGGEGIRFWPKGPVMPPRWSKRPTDGRLPAGGLALAAMLAIAALSPRASLGPLGGGAVALRREIGAGARGRQSRWRGGLHNLPHSRRRTRPRGRGPPALGPEAPALQGGLARAWGSPALPGTGGRSPPESGRAGCAGSARRSSGSGCAGEVQLLAGPGDAHIGTGGAPPPDPPRSYRRLSSPGKMPSSMPQR